MVNSIGRKSSSLRIGGNNIIHRSQNEPEMKYVDSTMDTLQTRIEKAKLEKDFPYIARIKSDSPQQSKQLQLESSTAELHSESKLNLIT